MERASRKQTRTRGSPALSRAFERQMPPPGEGVEPRCIKRKSSHDSRTVNQMSRISGSEEVYNLRSRVIRRDTQMLPPPPPPKAKRIRPTTNPVKESSNKPVQKVAVGKREASNDSRTLSKRSRCSDTEEVYTLRSRVIRRAREFIAPPPLKAKRTIPTSRDTAKAESSNKPVQKVAVGKRKASNDSRTLNKRSRCSDTEESTEVYTLRSRVIRRATQMSPPPPPKPKRTIPTLRETAKAEFEAKYQQQDKLGEGGCGSVFAGYRRADYEPVAIKHVQKNKIYCKHNDATGRQLSIEVAVMLRLQRQKCRSVGSSAPVALLDWYDLGQQLVLVHERPVPSKDLRGYIMSKGCLLLEEEGKIILRQLVDAAVYLQEKDIFHRDIKMENILIESDSDVPRVRLIDFGLCCFAKEKSLYHVFYGTEWHAPPEWSSNCQYSAGPTTVWQMGVVLFETLHHRERFKTHMYLRSLLSIRETLSKGCLDFMRLCLTEDPERRPSLKQIRLHPWLRKDHPMNHQS